MEIGIKMDFAFLTKLNKYNSCFWILEEDYGKIFESHDRLSIRHLYGKDRKVFVEVLRKNPEIKFRLLPPGESAITFTASDERLPLLEFEFAKVGAFSKYSVTQESIFNPKTMKELEEICQRHDSEISVDLIKNLFTLSYYTEILFFGEEDIESSTEESSEEELEESE